MATAYPGALDTSGSQLRTDIASTDDLDATGKQHDVMHVNVHGATIAVETKMGIGASAASGASDGDVMTKQADGSTAWEAAGAGTAMSGSTANGMLTYHASATATVEPNATYDGNTLALTSASSQNLQVVTTGVNSNAQMKFQNDARHYNVGIAGTDSDKFNFRDETASSTHLSIHSNGTVELETSGGGLKLDGLNSTNANTLDDYEEGTWTGTMSGAGGGTIGTDSATLGYVKVGKMVWCHGYFNVNAASSPAGNAHINTLPFTAEGGSTTMYALAAFAVYNCATEQKTIMGTAQQGATHVFLRGRFGETGVYSGNSAEWFANAGSSAMQVSVNFCYRAST